MAELISPAQMRAIEQAAIASGTVTGLTLMERAGQGVVDAIMAARPAFETTPGRAAILAGPGNNGGDGFVIARLLSQRGWAVSVYLVGSPDRLPPDAAENARRWDRLGEIRDLADLFETPDAVGGADLVVDALFGIGLSRPVSLPIDRLDRRDASGASGPFWVAVDVPSGLCADSGRTLGQHGAQVRADLTVTFHAAKPGHVLADGPRACGVLVVKDIGLHDGAFAAPADPDRLSLATGRPELLRKARGHKFAHGHALVLSGPMGRTGAARLAARAALRVGAGLVTLATPHDALAENAARLTSVMLREVDDAGALSRVLDDERLNALALGPGLGLDRARGLVRAALDARRATVLDADALSAFRDAPGDLFDLLHPDCVLTPHGGEFARLFPDIAARLAAPAETGPAVSKLDATREAARRAGAVVLYKGEDTVIADPAGQAAIHCAAYDRSAPWLATAGSGDVLTGLIAGLMARGVPAFHAATQAAWLHVEAARSFGPGLIAEDLPEELPKVFRTLGL